MSLGEAFDPVLSAARSGADWAWVEIYSDLVGPVTGYLKSRGADDPDDLASETFLQVARGIHSFVGDEQAFRSWVFVIAHRRLQSARRHASHRVIEVQPGNDAWARDIASEDNVERSVLAGAADTEVAALLAPLTEDQRTVLMLRIVADLSLSETAKVMGKKTNAVKALQHRALLALQKNASTP